MMGRVLRCMSPGTGTGTLHHFVALRNLSAMGHSGYQYDAPQSRFMRTRVLGKVQSVDQRIRLGMRCRRSPTADVPSHTSGAAMCQQPTWWFYSDIWKIGA